MIVWPFVVGVTLVCGTQVKRSNASALLDTSACDPTSWATAVLAAIALLAVPCGVCVQNVTTAAWTAAPRPSAPMGTSPCVVCWVPCLWLCEEQPCFSADTRCPCLRAATTAPRVLLNQTSATSCRRAAAVVAARALTTSCLSLCWYVHIYMAVSGLVRLTVHPWRAHFVCTRCCCQSCSTCHGKLRSGTSRRSGRSEMRRWMSGDDTTAVAAHNEQLP